MPAFALTRSQCAVSSAKPAVPRLRRPVVRHHKIVAFKESDRTVRDWRVKQMVDVANRYYSRVLSKGQLTVADDILTKHVVYNDMVLSPGQPIVGAPLVKARIESMRAMYPDLWYNVEQLGFCDSNHIFVQWTAEATNLGAVKGHAASHHHGTWYGMDMLGFSDDRSQISEIAVYRSLTSEEKQQLAGMSRTQSVVSFEDRYSLRLNRLHWEPQELRMPE